MGKEIERKFLIKQEFHEDDFDYNSHEYLLIKQGYFQHSNPCIRVRQCVKPGQQEASVITIKSKDVGIEDFEFEYPIPLSDATEMMSLYCGKRIVRKVRFFVQHDDILWVADFFRGPNHGLAIAEVELSSRDQRVTIPNWVGEEVTGMPEYKNYNLALKNEEAWKSSSKKSNL